MCVCVCARACCMYACIYDILSYISCIMYMNYKYNKDTICQSIKYFFIIKLFPIIKIPLLIKKFFIICIYMYI